MPGDNRSDNSDALEASIRQSLVAMLGGEILSLRRQPRWRPAWDVDMRIDGKDRAIHVRADKGRKYFNPMSLHQEAGVHRVLEAHGIPVPHVHGMMDDPVAIVMDRIPGQPNLATARDDDARESIRGQFIETLAALHRIPVSAFAHLGIPVPQTTEDIALNFYRQCETIYRERMASRPFALMEFLWRWVRDNIPRHRDRLAFITADSGQFLFEGDRLTGLLDFEISYLGDPLAEFAGLRIRDIGEPLGDINSLIDHYEALTGDSLDKASIEYHTAGFCTGACFLLWPLAFDPDIADDFVAYLSFSVSQSRWAVEAVAEAEGVDLVPLEPPAARPLTYSAAPRHLVANLDTLPLAGDASEYARGKLQSLALFLERSNRYGRALMNDNLADISALLGRPVNDPDKAEHALIEFINERGHQHTRALTGYFHRWLLRQDFLLTGSGPSSWGTGVSLQTIRDRG
ncbi:MAG: phosphotransferase [Porticoccaceae bacterium]|jgi:aminoglycoside phosphotransferase (APT) family kinase protein